MSKIKKIILLSAPFLAIPTAWLALEILQKYSMPCPLNFLTGLYCIGCGGTRCIEALLKGHLLLAIRQNLIVFSAVIFLTAFWIQLVTGKKLIPENRIFYMTATGIFIIYAVARNLIPEIAPL